MLAGGLILRYQGLYDGKGPCLAFRSPNDGVLQPPTGYSADEPMVLQEVTSKDLEWLSSRREQMRARNLPPEDIEHVIKELGGRS